jgi:hypothetical protein
MILPGKLIRKFTITENIVPAFYQDFGTAKLFILILNNFSAYIAP